MEGLDLPFVDLSLLEKSKVQNRRFIDVYEEVCNKIRESGALDNVMKDFQELESDLARVKYVFQRKDVQSWSVCAMDTKSEETALLMEDDYDILIRNESLTSSAKERISKSIKSTPNENKFVLARRYMKRAWASLLQEQFELALIDAQRCLAYGVSSRLTWNAYETVGHCYAKQGINKKSESFFKQAIEGLRNSPCPKELKAVATVRISTVLKTVKGRKDIKTKNKNNESIGGRSDVPAVSYGRHKMLECASNAVEVVYTKEMGRSIFATKDIKPGDYIIVEEPYVYSLNNDSLETHCVNCFRRLENPLPCATCSLIWFCGEKCRDEAETLHAGECKVLSLVYDDCIGKMCLLVFRIMWKATWKKLNSLRSSISELHTDSTAASREKQSADKWKWKADKYSTHDYLSTLHLVTNSQKRSFGDIFKRSLAAVYIGRCLQAANFFGAEDTEDNVVYAMGLALRHLQASACNAYGISEYVTQGADVSSGDAIAIELGGAIYPTISLTNHSCHPNTLRYSVGKSCVLRATRAIPKGTQVLDNYGLDFYAADRERRRELLNSQYKFTCDCAACVTNWPLYPHEHKLIVKCPTPKCSSVSIYQDDKSFTCAGCDGDSKQFRVLANELKFHLTEFGKALALWKKGNPKALSLFLVIQGFLDRVATPPGKWWTDCQVSIRRGFLTEGNKFHAVGSKRLQLEDGRVT